MADLHLHCEKPGDEDRIDVVLSRAFGGMDVPNLVRMLRERQPEFDPDLSICASDGDRIIGYTGFIPFDMRLMGSTVRAVAVAPVAVVPEYQRRGIAGMILRHGHDLARNHGCAVACLNGHPEYYPRHGYSACFGFCETTIDLPALPLSTLELEAWPLREDDLPWLAACDDREWRDVDFTWPRRERLTEWAIEGVNGVMWRTKDGERAAYSLNRAGQGGLDIHLESLLGEDPRLVRAAIEKIRPGKITSHPAGWLARAVLDDAWATCEAKRNAAAMACPLVDGVLDAYLKAVDSGQRLPGTINWPIPFMMC